MIFNHYLRIGSVICFLFLLATCKHNKNTSHSRTLDQNDQGAGASSEVVQSIMDESSQNFAKSGYSAKHSCQDASNIAVRIANGRGVPYRRLNFSCKGGGHAIVLAKIEDTDVPVKWCPQEPQNAGIPGRSSNIDDSFCEGDPSGAETPDFAAKLCGHQDRKSVV